MASAIVYPKARWAVMADDRVHPVPCVLRVSTVSASYVSTRCPSAYRMSVLVLPSRCPPFTRTAHPTSRHILPAARSMSSTVSIFMPDRISASGTLGVRSEAKGISSVRNTCRASSCISRHPLVETITGSMITATPLYLPNVSAMA